MSSLVFPDLPGRTWNVHRRPEWRTKRKPTSSGRKFRSTNWTYPIWHFEYSFELLRADAVNLELQQLVSLFNLMSGGLDFFLFKDEGAPWNSATDQAIGIGDGTTTEFALVRNFGGFIEPIGEKRGAITVEVDGSGTSAYELLDNRIVKFDTAPAIGDVITWTGGYYWRCIFSGDDLDTNQFMEQFWEARSVKFETAKA